MTTTLTTVGKRGTIVIPKAIREACGFYEGTRVEISSENNTVLIVPAQTRTRLDENFDRMRDILKARGVTLEMALATLTELKETHAGKQRSGTSIRSEHARE